ncbi:MAG: hypothetical protein WAN66_14195 [Limnoraphis robusta]|uniref:Uncharacterized protein n=1 Tax=Limnoraphis robusta CS-951 TaxID=1637645 RepID=A0A0F5YJ96_9CYAN|nr:hypothetical protein [Limnoraphis robusta]KKD38250.1 hypothetical protein WN50_09850 [Limnoraphis robusta CS-951]
MSFWSAKHQQLSLKLQLTPSATHFWQWMVNNPNSDAYDFRDFNDWVKTHRGKSYHRDTLKAAIRLLEDKGVINIVREFAWNIKRIVCYGIDKLLKKPPRKKSQDPAGNRKKSPQNQLHVKSDDIQQQLFIIHESDSLGDDHLINQAEELDSDFEENFQENIELVQAAGIELNVHQSDWLRAFTPKEVAMAIAYLLSQKNVLNPPGFLRRALEQGWEYYYTPRPIDWDKLYQRFAELIPNTWRK